MSSSTERDGVSSSIASNSDPHRIIAEGEISPDGIDRRGFLKCMAWAGTGLVWTFAGRRSGVARLSDSDAWPKQSRFSALFRSATATSASTRRPNRCDSDTAGGTRQD